MQFFFILVLISLWTVTVWGRCEKDGWQSCCEYWFNFNILIHCCIHNLTAFSLHLNIVILQEHCWDLWSIFNLNFNDLIWSNSPFLFHIFFCKLVEGIWFFIRIPPSSQWVCLSSLPPSQITYGCCDEKLLVDHFWELKGEIYIVRLCFPGSWWHGIWSLWRILGKEEYSKQVSKTCKGCIRTEEDQCWQ